MDAGRDTAEGTRMERRGFLVAAGATGVGLAVGAPEAASAASVGARPRRPAARIDEPMDLHFEIAHQTRPFDLVGRRFVTLDDSFDRDRGHQRLTPAPEHKGGRVRVGGGQLALSGTDVHTLFRTRARQRAPYAAVVVDIASFAGTGGAQDTVIAGLAKDAGDYVVGWYNHATGTGGIDLAVDGTVQTLSTASAAGTPRRVAFGLTSTTVVLLLDSGSGFQPLVKADLAGELDLRQPEALAAYHDTFGARTSSGTIRLASVRAGYFGETGLRDPHLVTYADGTPYVVDGKAYFTFTQAGLAFFETAHWGVWTVDLASHRLEQVANLFFQRDGQDTVLGDHAGHLVVDERNDRWILLNSTWGDFDGTDVHVNHTTLPLSRDLLHGVHVIRTRRLDLPVDQLPTAHVGQWDPCLVRIERRWHLAFVNASRFFVFYPALARAAAGADYTRLTQLLGSDSTKVATEGPILQKFGREWFLMASNGDDSPPEIRDQYPVYDLRVHQLGVLDAPHPTNIPWPMVFPVPLRDGRDRWLMVTFNGTQYAEPLLGYGTHGDVVVMQATPLTRPHQFPRHRPV